jgi:hypothetical protein
VPPFNFEVPDSIEEVKALFGKFDYTEHPTVKGDIVVDRGWVARHIVTVKDLPGYVGKSVLLHALVVDGTRAALEAAVAARPDYAIRRMAGFVPRHKLHDPNKPLSLHSWGICLDVNSDTNAYGTVGDIPPEFVKAFEDVGFLWGGHFKGRRDDMHFQCAYRC